MKKTVLTLTFLMAVSFLSIAQNTTQQAQEALQKVNKQFFIENKGQWPDEVLFLTRMGGLDAWITKNGITYDFYRLEETNTPENKREILSELHDIPNYIRNGHVVKTELSHTNPSPIPAGKYKQNGYYNYFIGNDSSKWASYVKLYNEAWVKQIYPGIDMRYYFDNQQLRYDYVVQPGADPKNIQFTFTGAYDFYITGNGDLAFTTRFGEVKQSELFVYQLINGQKIPVEASFTITNKQHISFRVGTYNTQYPLIIDPLIYSTFIGGTDGVTAFGITIDNLGNAYITGYNSSANYPTTPGVYQTSVSNIFVTKINPTGTALIYSTFIGSGGNANDIIIDNSNNVYITGNAPGGHPVTSGAFQTTNAGGADAFITKIDALGASLLYSTYVGGSGDEYGKGIIIDNSNNIYITGETYSSDYPVTPGAFQNTFAGGNYDIFVTKIDASGSSLLYSTYIGGSGRDGAADITIDNSNNVYITGHTGSSNYPITSGAFQTTNAGGLWGQDAFITKIDAFGTSLSFSTFIGGGSGDEYGRGITIDNSNNVYITGFTYSSDYPVTPGAFQNTFAGGNNDIFVTKIDASGSSLLYSTYIGGSDDDRGEDIKVNNTGIYITGFTYSWDYPVTTGAYQTSYGGGTNDVIVTKLNPSATAIIYSTFLGSGRIDRAYDMEINNIGEVYITGGTQSAGYPVTTNAYQTIHNGSYLQYNVFVTKLGVCLPTYDTLTVTACNSYTSPSGNYTWNTSGSYNDTLVNAAGCDSIVTVNLTINNPVTYPTTASICQGDSILLGGAYQTTAGTYQDTILNGAANGCDSIVVTTLTVNPVPVNNTTATICEGDSILLGGTYQTTAGTYQDTIPNGAANGCDSIVVTTLTINPVVLNNTTASICQGDSILLGGAYQTTAGTYQDTILNGAANGCDSIVVTTLTVNPVPVVSISGDTAVCAGKSITLTAGGASTYQWNTGETTAVITVTPTANTTYQVIGFNGSCSDTANHAITLLLPPTATASPDTLLEEGASVTLTASGGGTYLWYPSDYLSCNTCANPEATPEITTEYCVVVTANNTCSDTACITLQVEKICGEVFVPNILTPNDDGQHDRLEIFGNCLQNFTFTIYNRWGEKVFETSDLSETWDGTYKGQAVNNAVFHYLLRGTLTSGKEVEKHGTITLVK